jgi:hypothetical protein
VIASMLIVVVMLQDPAPAPGAQSSASADVSVVRLPARIAADLGRLRKRAPLFAIVGGGAAALAAREADRSTARSLGSSAAADAAFDAGAIGGSSAVQFGAAGALYALGLATGSAQTRLVGTSLLEAQAVEGLLTQAIKYSVQRRRPDGGRYSFPSGHTASAFATAEVLRRHFGWKAGLPAYLGAAYIAASRLSERQHYLSDVLFGAGIGIAAARTPGTIH